ncbi:MAG: peptidylprolyl isomerase [Pseudomonas sp.]|nr:peptidylprolyl isomerase [Pseudomonas sp.]
MKNVLACALAAALLVGVPLSGQGLASAQQLQPIDRIAAVVNEDVILRSELDRAVANITQQYRGRENQLPPRDVLERQVLERLVLIKLQVARAQETGVRVTDQEIDQAIGAIAQQNRLSPEQLRAQVTSDGTSFGEFRNSIRDELLIQRLRQRFAQGRIQVSEAEIEAAMSVQAAAGSQYRLAHILVALPEGATAAQIATAQQKIEGVKSLLDRGEMDFAAAAVRYSDSPNALEGGDLGWRSSDEIPNAFAEMVRRMSPGDVSAPLRGPSGFQLLKLVEVRDAAADAAANMVTQFQARHILVRVADPSQDAAAKAKVDTLAARLAGGADFAELARQESQDLTTQPTGGDLGWFAADAFGPQFGGQVAALQDGQVSPPFRTEAGWHIVQRMGSRQVNATDQTRRAQISETIGRRKLEDEWNRFLRELRGEAFVDVRGQTDTPAAAPATGG